MIVTPGTGVTLRSKERRRRHPIADTDSWRRLRQSASNGTGNEQRVVCASDPGVTGGIAVPISGLVTANPGTAANWEIGATGSAVPANAVYMGIISGGNLTGWTGAVTQGTAANLNATVVGTGTFAVQATLQASAGTAIGKVDPNTLATSGVDAARRYIEFAGERSLRRLSVQCQRPNVHDRRQRRGAMHDQWICYRPGPQYRNSGHPRQRISAPTGTPPSTSSPVTAFNEAYNGSTWDAMQDDANKNLKVAPQASPVGGALSSTWLPSAASNNATNVKNAAGTLYSVTVTQSTTTAMELKLYNTSSSPTCSSATGLVDIIPIPSNAISPGYHIPYPVGRAFSTGISFCLVAFGAPAAGTDNSNAVTGATVSMTYD